MAFRRGEFVIFDECEEEDKNIVDDSTESKEECRHENKIEELNICKDCGLEISAIINVNEAEWRYYGADDSHHSSDPSRVHLRKNEEKSIFNDLKKSRIPETIKKKMNETYLTLTKGNILRGDKRKGLIFAIAFYIYRQSDEEKQKTKQELLEMMPGIPESAVSEGIAEYTKRMKKNKIPIEFKRYVRAEDYINELMEGFDASKEHKMKVKEVCASIHNKSSILNAAGPRSVATAVLWYYMKQRGTELECSKYAEKVGLSNLTIQKYTKEIEKVLKMLGKKKGKEE